MAYLILVSIIWALSFGLIKGKLTGLDPSFVSAARMLLAAVVFLPFLRLPKLSARTSLILAGIGAVQYGLMYVLYTWSFQVLKAYEVALLTIMTPLYVAVIDAVLERRTVWIYLLSAILAVIGTGICIWQEIGRPGMAMGALAVQGSNLCFAIGQLWYRRAMPAIGAKDREVFAVLYLAGAAVALLAMTLTLPQWRFALTFTHISVLLYLGVVASGVCFFLWNLGARRTNVGSLAAMNNLKIPLGILASAVVFGESKDIDWLRLLAGGGIIVMAVLLSSARLHLSPAKEIEDEHSAQ